MNKCHFIFDKNKKSLLLKKKLKNFKKYSIKKCNTIIVAGGDGFMLKNLKKFYNFQKPFYGINCGTIGFLMNKKQEIFSLKKKIAKAKKFAINPIEIYYLTLYHIFDVVKRLFAIFKLCMLFMIC